MASLNTIYLKKEKIQNILKVLEIKGLNGIELTIQVKDEVNQYSQNVTAYVSQSKEDREAKKEKFYIGNGNTVWTDGKIQAFKKELKDSQDKTNFPEPKKHEPIFSTSIIEDLDSDLDDLPF
jgi:hypothetical protein